MKLNGHEKTAATNIKNAFEWIVGGYYNCMQDGEEEYIPTLEEAKEEVYNSAMNNLYRKGYEGFGKAPKEMRFAGEEFCRCYVEKLFDEDSDVAEIPWKTEEEELRMMNKYEDMTVAELKAEAKAAGIKGTSKMKKADLIEALKDAPTDDDDNFTRVKMFAFTGMPLGEFDCEVTDEYILVYTQSRGELQFDKKTGKEITEEKKARYANRVERA